jgi:hypothetical protein
MNKPNFFIIGAPKCGTTALFKYLRGHPGIYCSPMKEPFFFCTDFPGHARLKSVHDYLKLFQDSGPQHQAIGEGSTLYLYSQVAVRNLLQFSPQAKLIVMLRNPVDMVYSLHSQELFSFNEREQDFEHAWRLQEPRARGEQLPPRCRTPALLQYGRVAQFGAQLERLFEQVPRERILPILFDEFAASPGTVYRKVLSFLHVPHDDRTEFPRVNEQKKHRVRWLSRLLLKPPFPLKQVKNGCRWLLGKCAAPMGQHIRKVILDYGSRTPLSPGFRRELIDYFRSDVRTIERLLDVDLHRWHS